MKKTSTTTSSAKQLQISESTKRAYRKRDRALDTDADAPQLPPSYWAGASIGKYYRPLKTQISLRIDNEVLDWLKSKGEGHLIRINEILRERMASER
jgi:uncharacterized protein (DUF4415 family)